jgi:hypothetical protein
MNCETCGATLSLDDMTRPNCPYCKNVLKHHARAAEHAALVNKVLDDRIRAQYPGIPPGQVPQIGYGFGAPMNASFQQFQAQQVQSAVKRAGWITLVAVLVPLVMMLVIGGGMVAWMLLSR